VNGDGYCDILIGTPYVNGQTGKVDGYLGSPAGLPPAASWTVEGESGNGCFGISGASAGDVNGDGYSDAVVGAYAYDAVPPMSNEGKAYVFLGGGGPGMPVVPQQQLGNGEAPIAPLGRAEDGLFRLAAKGRTPFGRGDVKVEWQVAPLGGTFSPALNPPQSAYLWSDSGTGGAALGRTLVLDEGDGPYLWRMRTKYRAATTPFQGHGPWMTPAADGLHETDLRRVPSVPPPACVPPDEPCWLYAVEKEEGGPACTLNWQDPNQEEQRTGWNIRRHYDLNEPFESWPLVGSNVVDMDIEAPDYQWTDQSGEDPPEGEIWYYQVNTYSALCPPETAEGPF
jgi:hypothetical protein